MSWLRKYYQRIAIMGLIFIVLILSAFLIRSPHLWKKYTDAEILRNGQPASEASLYYSRSGLLFIDMGTNDEWYYFSNEQPHMGTCNRMPRHIPLLGYVYMIDDGQNLPCIVYSDVKSTDPHLKIEQDSIEFDSRKGGRIRIKWKDAAKDKRAI